MLRKAFFGKAETDETAESRVIKFTISTNAVDLDNDTVDQAGWDLSVFKSNPLVLWMHDSTMLPVGKCVAIDVENGALKASVEFATQEDSAFADQVFIASAAKGFYPPRRSGFYPWTTTSPTTETMTNHGCLRWTSSAEITGVQYCHRPGK